jgi:broad specificity phosphatase PhoE
MNTLRLIVVRHAQTFENVHQPPEPGCGPSNLSPLGREQCRHLAQALAGRIECAAGVTIYSSSAVRAVDTAGAIRAALGGDKVPLVVTDDLLEMGYGELGAEVKDTRDLSRVVAEKRKLWQDGGGHLDDFKLPGGKSVREMMGCARRAVAECLIGRSHQTVVVVAHEFFNGVLFRSLLALPNGVPQHNACINELRVSAESLAVSPGWILNDTSHLPAELRDEPAPPRFDHAAGCGSVL